MASCMWRSDWWSDLCGDDESLKVPVITLVNEPERSAASEGVIRVEFHKDQGQLLVVGESQLAVYDGSIVERRVEWAAESPFTAAITDATFSCGGEFVYAGFGDGCVGVFDGRSLSPRCRLAQPFYTPRGMRQGVSGGNCCKPCGMQAVRTMHERWRRASSGVGGP